MNVWKLVGPRHFSQPRHRLGLHQGDRQRKQEDGPVDQRSDTYSRHIRKEQDKSMNRDEGSYQLLRIYDYLLFTVATPGE